MTDEVTVTAPDGRSAHSCDASTPVVDCRTAESPAESRTLPLVRFVIFEYPSGASLMLHCWQLVVTQADCCSPAASAVEQAVGPRTLPLLEFTMRTYPSAVGSRTQLARGDWQEPWTTGAPSPLADEDTVAHNPVARLTITHGAPFTRAVIGTFSPLGTGI